MHGRSGGALGCLPGYLNCQGGDEGKARLVHGAEANKHTGALGTRERALTWMAHQPHSLSVLTPPPSAAACRLPPMLSKRAPRMPFFAVARPRGTGTPRPRALRLGCSRPRSSSSSRPWPSFHHATQRKRARQAKGAATPFFFFFFLLSSRVLTCRVA